MMNPECSSNVTTSHENMTICGYGNDKYWENNKCHNNNILIALVDVFVQTIAKMVCFSLFPLCKTKSLAIS